MSETSVKSLDELSEKIKSLVNDEGFEIEKFNSVSQSPVSVESSFGASGEMEVYNIEIEVVRRTGVIKKEFLEILDRQKSQVEAGERGEALEDVVSKLGLN